MTDHIYRRRFVGQLLAGLGLAIGGGAMANSSLAAGEPPLRRTPKGDLLETVPKGALPSFAIKGSPKVQEAYRYAAEHGEPLRYIPCFCGCKSVGHRNNEDCYVTERHADGRITFNSHSAG
jgi:hypothetical protein